MQTFTFIDLYTGETSTVRTVMVRGDITKGEQPMLRHLGRWMGKDTSRKIVGFLVTEQPDALHAQHWLAAI